MSTLYRESICKFIISLLLCFFYVSGIQAQIKQVEAKTDTTTTNFKFLDGVFVQVDAASLISTAIFKSTTYSMEGGVQFDIRHKYFPVVEIGYAGADKIANNDVLYKSDALFGRVGIDFNLSKPKKDALPTNNLLLGGLRLGMSNFGYNISNVVIADDYWGGTETPDFSNKNASKIWFEIVFSVRVEILRNTYMGWTVRNKNLIGKDAVGEVFPWFIPGFGINKSSNWGINYMIGYRF